MNAGPHQTGTGPDTPGDRTAGSAGRRQGVRIGQSARADSGGVPDCRGGRPRSGRGGIPGKVPGVRRRPGGVLLRSGPVRATGRRPAADGAVRVAGCRSGGRHHRRRIPRRPVHRPRHDQQPTSRWASRITWIRRHAARCRRCERQTDPLLRGIRAAGGGGPRRHGRGLQGPPDPAEPGGGAEDDPGRPVRARRRTCGGSRSRRERRRTGSPQYRPNLRGRASTAGSTTSR